VLCGRADWRFPSRAAAAFFVSTPGHRLLNGNLRDAFAAVGVMAGLPARIGGHGPRLTDILTGWHRGGLDAGARLSMLSAYLGPVSPAPTSGLSRRRPAAGRGGRTPRPPRLPRPA